MSRTRRCIGSPVHDRPRFARLARLGPLVLALAAALSLLLGAGTAEAGSFQIKNPRPEEDDGRWKLAFTFNYGKKPHMGHIPMIFSFKHVKQYMWAYTEASPEKAVFETKVLNNQTEINIPVDVGFADMKGDIYQITKFKIELRRDRDFEAGEYTLTVRQEGRTFGRPTRVTLKGKNKPLDRRPIEFKAKPIGGGKKANTGPPEGETDDPTKGHDMGDVMATDEELASVEDDEPDGPPAEKPKQGGCGCRVVGLAPAPGSLGVVLLGLVAVLVGLRRRRR